MNTPLRPPRIGARTSVIAGYAALSSACGVAPRDRATAPVTPQATEIDGLWTMSLWMGVAVWIAVMVLLAVPIVRSRRSRGTEPATSRGGGFAGREQAAPPGAELDEPMIAADPDDHGAARADARVRSRLLWIGGIVGPVVILLVLLVASGRVGSATAHVTADDELVIDVVGHMFWWEVRYPEQDITTANEIHVPVDRHVRLRLTTDDVIHSFWIPTLHGKIDMLPGSETWLSFETTETGRFRGQCAEFCGIAHAQMVAFVEVQEPSEFDAWVADQQQAAGRPDPDRSGVVEGERVFLDAGCAACHAVEGTAAVGGVGPDLTHLASRGSLAAGIVPNSRENLGRLVVDPWSVKPGIKMPPTMLDDEELDVLLDYLETLQ